MRKIFTRIFGRFINNRLVNYLSHHQRFNLFLFFFLLASLPLGIYLVQHPQLFQPQAEEIDFYGKRIRVLKLFGQRSVTETSRNEVTSNTVYHAAGVLVDRNSTPNKVYVVDTGNNRILGYNGVGYCSNNNSQVCTIDSDCGSGNTCQVDGTKQADIVIGQPDFSSSACNWDNNLGISKNPTASTLCFIQYPEVSNIAEAWGRINLDVDSEGNLYVPDQLNDRVLKYNNPFSADRSNGKGDTVADFVLGQDGFTSNGPNRQNRYSGDVDTVYENTLHLSIALNHDVVSASGGVSLDPEGNVWVADTYNSRVLRFAPGATLPNLVIGKQSLTESSSFRTCASLHGRLPISPEWYTDRFCTPTLAKVHPRTGELYILDEHNPGFKARILVFQPPFTNGMSAYKVVVPRQQGEIAGFGSYYFQSTGFEFNPYREGEYAQGEVWVNEHQTNRTLLLDREGNILKVFGARDANTKGGERGYPNCYVGDEQYYRERQAYWPGGNIGFDSANNIYLADETNHHQRIYRYSLPLQNNFDSCPPHANGTVLRGYGFNSIYGQASAIHLGESVGMTVFGNQLIVQDEQNRLKVWDDYTQKNIGAPADYVISGDVYGRPLAGRNFLSGGVDDQGRMWLSREHGQIRIYQLPFQYANVQPLADDVRLYWQDDQQEVSYGGAIMAFDSIHKWMYVADTQNNRILRVKNYNDFAGGRLLVDMVIGQRDKNGVNCNFDQLPGWRAPAGSEFPNSLCGVSQIKFDKEGNLYVVENGYECHGNHRISVFMKEDLENAQGMFPLISARKFFRETGFFPCYSNQGPGSPVSLAFNSRNQLVIGNDGYFPSFPARNSIRHLRQLWIYNDPLNSQTPDGFIELPMGAPGELAFDSQDNLLIQDHTWYRVWMINLDQDTDWTNGAWSNITARLTVEPSVTQLGNSLRVTWQRGGSGNVKDWIGLYKSGQNNDRLGYKDWFFVNSCVRFNNPEPISSGNCDYLFPSGLDPGEYELRYFSNNGYSRLATVTFEITELDRWKYSELFSGFQGQNNIRYYYHVNTGLVPVPFSQAVAEEYNGSIRWISKSPFAQEGESIINRGGLTPGTYLDPAVSWSAPRAGRVNIAGFFTRFCERQVEGSVTFKVGKIVYGDPGTGQSFSSLWERTVSDCVEQTYEIEAEVIQGEQIYFLVGSGSNQYGTADFDFEIRYVQSGASLTIGRDSVEKGGRLNVSWQGLEFAAVKDWIGMYRPDAQGFQYTSGAWLFLNCQKNAPESPVSSGSCEFIVPENVSLGIYELRLNANNGYQALAKSPVFEVIENAPVPIPTPVPAPSALPATPSATPYAPPISSPIPTPDVDYPLEVSPEAVDVTIRAGATLENVVIVTGRQDNTAWFTDSLRDAFGIEGIEWYTPATYYINAGESLGVGIQVSSSVSPGVYSGIAEIGVAGLGNNTIRLPVTVRVTN